MATKYKLNYEKCDADNAIFFVESVERYLNSTIYPSTEIIYALLGIEKNEEEEE